MTLDQVLEWPLAQVVCRLKTAVEQFSVYYYYYYYYYSRLSTFDTALVADASEGEVTIVTSESKGLSILFWFIAH